MCGCRSTVRGLSNSSAAVAATYPPPKMCWHLFVRRHSVTCRQWSRRKSGWQMSSEAISEYEIVHQKPKAFYDRFERKAELQHQTHFCPGCGHGIVHKLLAQALDDLGVQDRTVLISPVGCSVF